MNFERPVTVWFVTSAAVLGLRGAGPRHNTTQSGSEQITNYRGENDSFENNKKANHPPDPSRRTRRGVPSPSCGRSTSRTSGTGGSTRRSADTKKMIQATRAGHRHRESKQQEFRFKHTKISKRNENIWEKIMCGAFVFGVSYPAATKKRESTNKNK